MKEKSLAEGVQRENLKELALREAGKCEGNLDVFKTFIQQISNGKLIDESTNIELTTEQRVEIKSKIEKFEKDKKTTIKDAEEAEHEKIRLKEKREELSQELQGIRLGKSPEGYELFSPVKFGINVFFLLMLSIYLFLFYVSATYEALFVPLEELANKIMSGVPITILPGPSELTEALSSNYLLLFAPFIFFGFGYAIHVILDSNNKLKYLIAGSVLAATFVLDFLIAYLVHNTRNEAKDLIDLPTDALSQSSAFYIILFMGFVVYLIWSVLLNSGLNEWGKRNVESRIQKEISRIRKSIDDNSKIRDCKTKIEKIEKEIRNLKHALTNAVVGITDISNCMAIFSGGWNHYLSLFDKDSLKQEQTNAIVEKFEKELSDAPSYNLN